MNASGLSSHDHLCCRTHQANNGNKGTLEALAIFKGHTSVVEDVAWHTTSPNIFGSCGKMTDSLPSLRTCPAFPLFPPHPLVPSLVSRSCKRSWAGQETMDWMCVCVCVCVCLRRLICICVRVCIGKQVMTSSCSSGMSSSLIAHRCRVCPDTLLRSIASP